MNKSKISILASLLLVGSTAVYGGSIVNSPHNLSVANVSGNDASTADNGEICVYCHTPHAANIAFDGAPLWNKNDTTSKSYMMYGATTVDTAGSTIAGTPTAATPSNPSLACLSCHDGISAIDSIVNAPGSGMNSVTGSHNIVTALTTTFGGNIGGVPGTATSGTTVDLSNDHPVSIVYDVLADGTRAGSLKATSTVLTGWSGATDIASLLRNGKVECSSCHDPHNGGNTQGVSTEVNFLRMSNTGSALCVGCHNK